MIKLKKIHKTFSSGLNQENYLFKNLNLSISKGEFVTIIGANGSGKSTLLNIISGDLGIDKGEVWLEGQEISSYKNFQRYQFMSKVFQDPQQGTAPSLSVLENLKLAMHKGKLFNLSPLMDQKIEFNLLNEIKMFNMGLEDKLNVPVGRLSGGQRQALSLLMASLNTPRLLLLDEHTAALDPKSSETIMNLTEKLINEKAMTSLMVTHNIKDAIRYGDRLLMFYEGNIIHDISGEDKRGLSQEDIITMFQLIDPFFNN